MPDSRKVALEMLHVDCIEADGCGIEADVELGQLLSEKIRPVASCEEFFTLIQRCEDGNHVCVICSLVGREACFVYPGVEIALHPDARLVDLLAEMLRI